VTLKSTEETIMQTVTSLDIRTITTEEPLSVCFVCLGNICRSPTAEGVFQHLVNKNGFSSLLEVDSAGTAAYHVGEPANSKSRLIAEQNGVTLNSKARKFEYPDLEYFDLVIAMDKENHRDLLRLDRKGQFRDKIFLLRDFDPVPGDGEVPDPYYGGLNGFELVYEIVLRSCESLLDTVRPHLKNGS
jgi:protein-tyrosine phosphatase